MTTKNKIAELILRRLSKYTDESDIDPRELMLAVHQSLSSLIRVRFFESKSTDFQEVDGALYYTIKDNSVLEDKTTNTYYTLLPSSTISIPYGVDIKRVGPPKGRGYTPTQLGFNDLYDGLPSCSLEGKIGYNKEGNKLNFVNMGYDLKPESVNITMTLPLDAMDEDEEINIPADMVDEVVERVFQKYTTTLQIPSDEVNNSID